MKTYVVINSETGMVENTVVWDGEAEWSPPEGFFVVESGVAGIGWHYADGEFTAPPEPEIVPPSPAEVLAANTSTRDTLLAKAILAIAPLQDAVDLDEATSAEAALLKKWKQYRVAVNRIDLTKVDPVWPVQP